MFPYLINKNISLFVFKVDIFDNYIIYLFINIENQDYRLAGIVSYKKSGKSGHYVAYVNNIINWYKYDDMHAKRYIITEEEIVMPHVIMFIKV